MKKPFYRKWWFFLIIVLIVLGRIVNIFGEDENDNAKKDNTPKHEEAAKKEISTKSDEKSRTLTLEEQSKQFIDENLEGKTIVDFTNKLLTVKDEKLFEMIVLGHKNGQQFKDDFDILGRKATASGVITEFAYASSNIGQKRRGQGTTTSMRTDKFTIYMGNKDIENYDFIEYDELFHKDKNKNEFFLGAYPEEITNFAIIDLDQEVELKVGQKVTVEGIIKNYVIKKDYADNNKIEDFSLLLDSAVLK